MTRIVNETDEPLHIEPGEQVNVEADEEIVRLMSTRKTVLKVTEIRT